MAHPNVPSIPKNLSTVIEVSRMVSLGNVGFLTDARTRISAALSTTTTEVNVELALKIIAVYEIISRMVLPRGSVS
jgi:hypothetical protein